MTDTDIWLEGSTCDGDHVKIICDPYCSHDSQIYVNDVRANIRSIYRLRDGGTTKIETDLGMIVRQQRRWASQDGTFKDHTLDGEPMMDGAS